MAPISMFYAAENLLMAALVSEGIDVGAVRRKTGNHQLDRMLDELPDACAIKSSLENIIDLVAYATTYRYPTPAGNLPKPPSQEDAMRYFEILVETLEVCVRHFQVDVELEEPEAGTVLPIR